MWTKLINPSTKIGKWATFFISENVYYVFEEYITYFRKYIA